MGDSTGGSTFARIGTIAHNTFKEALRSKALIGLVVVATALLLSSMLLSEMTLMGQGARVVLDFGFFAIGLFGAVTAIVLGALLLHKEVEKKTIYTIISKPVRRYEFLIGKYFGMLWIIGLQLVALMLVWFLVLMMKDADISLEHVKGIVLIYFEMTIITAAAVMFSSISSPVMTAVFSTGLFFVGRALYLISDLLVKDGGFFTKNEWLRPFAEATVTVFPDLSVFNISQSVLLGIETSGAYVGSALVYALGYSVCLLVIAVIAFQRRDFI